MSEGITSRKHLTKNAGEHVRKDEPLLGAGGSISWFSHYWNSKEVSQKSANRIAQFISLGNVYPKDSKSYRRDTWASRLLLPDSQQLKKKQEKKGKISISRRMDKVANICSRVSLSWKGQWNHGICRKWVQLENSIWSEIN